MHVIDTIQSPDSPLDQHELMFRRKALRDAVLCIGWLKLTSLTCYVVLYILVHLRSNGHMSLVLQIMLLVMIPAQLITGTLLLLGALQEKIIALEVALWLCLLLAAYTTVLGLIGCVYFIRNGHLTVHFILALLFASKTCSLITVCHDFVIIYAYTQILKSGPELEITNSRWIFWRRTIII